MKPNQRIELIDALRGVCLCVMVVHHFLYDLVVFCDQPWSLFSNPFWDVVHYLCAGLFILLCGVSSNFSHSNVRRGGKTLLFALLITVVTAAMDMTIVFGILHLLGICMLLYGLTQSFWQKLPPWVIPLLALAGTLLTAKLTDGYPTDIPHLWMFGLVTPSFSSEDYFPLLPWIFIFLFGTWLGKYIAAGKFPRWFYTVRAPLFAPLGRHSMLIYLAHQPVLFALVMAGRYLFLK